MSSENYVTRHARYLLVQQRATFFALKTVGISRQKSVELLEEIVELYNDVAAQVQDTRTALPTEIEYHIMNNQQAAVDQLTALTGIELATPAAVAG